MVIKIVMKRRNEEQIIQGLISREEGACVEVRNRFLPAFIAHVRRKFNGDRTEAETLFHEALLDVIENLTDGKFTWTGEDSFAKYFFTIEKFKALTFYRDKWRSKKREQTTSIDWESEIADLADTLPDPQALQEKEAADLGRTKQLDYCMNQLKSADRDLLTMFYVDNFAWKKIATLLNISHANARTKANRLREKLKHCIESRLMPKKTTSS